MLQQDESQIWQLVSANGTLFGTLTLERHNMPWYDCHFVSAVSFEQVAVLFAAERRLLDADDMDAWAAAYEKIDALELELHPAEGGSTIKDFLLHIHGQKAWFRY